MASKLIVTPQGIEQLSEQDQLPPWVPGGEDCGQPSVDKRRCRAAGLPQTRCGFSTLCSRSHYPAYRDRLDEVVQLPREKNAGADWIWFDTLYLADRRRLDLWLDAEDKLRVVDRGGPADGT